MGAQECLVEELESPLSPVLHGWRRKRKEETKPGGSIGQRDPALPAGPWLSPFPGPGFHSRAFFSPWHGAPRRFYS